MYKKSDHIYFLAEANGLQLTNIGKCVGPFWLSGCKLGEVAIELSN